MAQALEYRYRRTEPAVMVEMYLPKRASFQGPLFATLTEAIRNPQVIKDHFNDPARQKRIRKFLQADAQLAGYTPAWVERLPPLLFGFSMYEVDGAFMATDGEGVAEERSQVMRLFFKYTIPAVYRDDADMVCWIQSFFRSPASSVEEFRRLVPGARKVPREVFDALQEWIEAVWLIVHGFVLFRICDCVSEVSRREDGERGRRRDALPHYQREIWVVSAWTCQVNRAVDVALSDED